MIMVPDKKQIRLLLTGGGTGGHLFPALASAEEMCLRYPGTEVLFIGTRRKIDQHGLKQTGYRVKHIFSYGLKGKRIGQLLKALLVLPVSCLQAAFHILLFKPTIVLGVGGYVTGPVIVAAKLLGKRTVIHEQNSVPGLANRKLGGIVDKICISLPQSASFFPESKTHLTGNPVRRALLDVAKNTENINSAEKRTLLVLGGSLGAHRLNELVTQALCQYLSSLPVKVIHQTGDADYTMVKEKYAEHGVNAIVEPFFNNMAEIYAEADLLVSRAGATTLAEIAVLGKAAILIPYPFAADNHQHKNADYYVDGGGCLKFSEEELTDSELAQNIQKIFDDRQLMEMMSKNMKKLGVHEAAANIVNVCMSGPQRKEKV